MQVKIIGDLTAEMDEHTRIEYETNRLHCDSWKLFRRIMPERVNDWFAQLETIPSWRQKCKEKDDSCTVTVIETTEQEFRELCISEPHLLDGRLA